MHKIKTKTVVVATDFIFGFKISEKFNANVCHCRYGSWYTGYQIANCADISPSPL